MTSADVFLTPLYDEDMEDVEDVDERVKRPSAGGVVGCVERMGGRSKPVAAVVPVLFDLTASGSWPRAGGSASKWCDCHELDAIPAFAAIIAVVVSGEDISSRRSRGTREKCPGRKGKFVGV